MSRREPRDDRRTSTTPGDTATGMAGTDGGGRANGGGIYTGIAGGARRLGQATAWKRWASSFVAGSASVLAMPPFFLAPVLFLTLPILVWLIDASAAEPDEVAAISSPRRALGRAALAGWFFGFGYFVFGLFWIGEAFLVEAEKFAWLLPAAVTLLPAFLALFFAAAAAGARYFWRAGVERVLVLAIALAAAEWLRGHVLTGLPWNILGYALTPPGAAMQSAALVGVYGLTLITVAAFAAPLVALSDAGPLEPSRRRNAIQRGVLPSLAVLALVFAYGSWRLAGATDDVVPGVKLRIVQPSVPQRDKWQREKQREIFDLHLGLSRLDATGRVDDLAGVTHLVWPEAAMPFLPLESQQALDEIAALLPDGTYLLTGALRAERPVGDGAYYGTAPAGRPAVYNSMMVFSPDGALNQLYDKIHLVPFGEYLPMQTFLESIGLEQLTRLRGGFAVGRKPRPVMDVPGLPPLIALICYEAIFPAAVVQGDDRPGLLVNVTNDGWFGRTTGPYQHFHNARVRAVEEGVPVIRAANNGVSAMIDPYGRVGATLDLDVRGVIDARLPRQVAPPPYARYGDRIFLTLLLAAVMALLAAAEWRARGRRGFS